MSGEKLETIVDIDGVIIGFVSSQGDEGDRYYEDDLAVYDANYDFIGSARSLRVAEQLLRQRRADVTTPSNPPRDRRFAHSFR